MLGFALGFFCLSLLFLFLALEERKGSSEVRIHARNLQNDKTQICKSILNIYNLTKEVLSSDNTLKQHKLELILENIRELEPELKNELEKLGAPRAFQDQKP